MPTVNTETIGASGEDHSSINAWENATDNDLVTGDVVEVGELVDASYTDESMNMQNATTDSTRYRIIRAASGNERDPIAGTGCLITYTASISFDINESYSRMECFGLNHTGSTGNYRIRLRQTSNIAHAMVIDASGGTFAGSSFAVLGLGTTSVISNCIAIGSGTSSEGFTNVFVASSGSAYHCATYNNNRGAGYDTLGDTAGAVTNCVAHTHPADADFGAVLGTESYNASGDSSAAGTGSLTSVSLANMFNDAGSDDFRPGTSTQGEGTDISTTFDGFFNSTTHPAYSGNSYKSFEPGVYHDDNGSSSVSIGPYLETPASGANEDHNEDLDATESLNLAVADAESESLEITETDSLNFGQSNTDTDTMEITESIGQAFAQSNSASDALEATESEALAVSLSFSEALEATESETHHASQLVPDTDTLELSETLQLQLAYSFSDTLEATETGDEGTVTPANTEWRSILIPGSFWYMEQGAEDYNLGGLWFSESTDLTEVMRASGATLEMAESLAVGLLASYGETLEATETDDEDEVIGGQEETPSETLELTETLTLALSYSFADALEATETDDESSLTTSGSRSILVPGVFWYVEAGTKDLNLTGLWFSEGTTSAPSDTVTSGETLELTESLSLQFAASYGETLEATEDDVENESGSGQSETPSETLEITESLALALAISSSETLEITETDNVDSGSFDITLEFVQTSGSLSTATPTGFMAGSCVYVSARRTDPGVADALRKYDFVKWDFDDPGSIYFTDPRADVDPTLSATVDGSTNLEGWCQAWVYDTAGTYDITCTYRNANGLESIETVSVTIDADTRTHRYVAASGGDNGGTGDVGDPWATLDYALTQVSDDMYIHLERGGSYTKTGSFSFASIDNFVLGAYGSGAKPAIDCDMSSGASTWSASSNDNNIVIRDVAFSSTNNGWSSANYDFVTLTGVGGFCMFNVDLTADTSGTWERMLNAAGGGSTEGGSSDGTPNDKNAVGLALINYAVLGDGAFADNSIVHEYVELAVHNGLTGLQASASEHTSRYVGYGIYDDVDNAGNVALSQCYSKYIMNAALGAAVPKTVQRYQSVYFLSVAKCWMEGSTTHSMSYDGAVLRHVRFDGNYYWRNKINTGQFFSWGIHSRDILMANCIFMASGDPDEVRCNTIFKKNPAMDRWDDASEWAPSTGYGAYEWVRHPTYRPDSPSSRGYSIHMSTQPHTSGSDFQSDLDAGLWDDGTFSIAENWTIMNCDWVAPDREANPSFYPGGTNSLQGGFMWDGNSSINEEPSSTDSQGSFMYVRGFEMINNRIMCRPSTASQPESYFANVYSWDMFATPQGNIFPSDAQWNTAMVSFNGPDANASGISDWNSELGASDIATFLDPEDFYGDPEAGIVWDPLIPGTDTGYDQGVPTVLNPHDWRRVTRDQDASSWQAGPVGAETASTTESASETLQITESIDVDAPGQEGEAVTLELTEADTYALAMSSPETVEATEVGTYAVSLSFTEALQLTEDDTEIEDVGNVTVPETLEITEADAYAIALSFSEALQIEEGTDEVFADTDALEITETIGIGLAYSFAATAEITEVDQEGTAGEIARDLSETLSLTEAIGGIPQFTTETLEITETILTTATATNTVAMRIRAFIRTFFFRGWSRS